MHIIGLFTFFTVFRSFVNRYDTATNDIVNTFVELNALHSVDCMPNNHRAKYLFFSFFSSSTWLYADIKNTHASLYCSANTIFHLTLKSVDYWVSSVGRILLHARWFVNLTISVNRSITVVCAQHFFLSPVSLLIGKQIIWFHDTKSLTQKHI